MENIFVVSGGVDYEGSAPLRAFTDKGEADAFSVACQEYENGRPEFDESDSEQWLKALAAWQGAHPGGENGHGCDYYVVREIPLGAAAPIQPTREE